MHPLTAFLQPILFPDSNKWVNGRNDKTENLITIEKTKEPFEQQLQWHTHMFQSPWKHQGEHQEHELLRIISNLICFWCWTSIIANRKKKKCCDLLSRVVGRQSNFGSSKAYLLMQGAKCCTNTCKQQTAGITLVQNAFASDGAFVYDQTLVRVPLFVTRSACGTENSRSAIRVWHEAALKESPQDPKGKTLLNEHPRIIIIIIIIIIITAVPRVMCCASWSTSFRRAAKSKTDNIHLLHNHLLLLLLLPIVGNVHSDRSGSRLLLLLSSSSLRSPRSALFVFRGRI